MVISVANPYMALTPSTLSIQNLLRDRKGERICLKRPKKTCAHAE